MNDTYNVAVIGQTGVGKSALINYLFDKDAPSGTGKPITAEGFHEYEGTLNPGSEHAVKVKIFDSWGLEVGKEAEWNKMFKKELEVRGLESHPKDWFHSVIYCIGASSNRVQNADIKIIKEALANEYPVTVALTKADSISEEDEAILIKEIEASLSGVKNIRIVPVCAVKKKKRDGTSTKAFGKESLEKAILSQVLTAISIRLPYSLKTRLTKRIEEWYDSCSNLIESETGTFSTDEVVSKLQEKVEHVQRLLPSERDSILNAVFAAYQNVYLAHGMGKIAVKINESENDFGVLGTILIIIGLPLFIPAALLYALFKGKSDNKENLYKEIIKARDSLYLWMEKEINSFNENIKKSINKDEKNLPDNVVSFE